MQQHHRVLIRKRQLEVLSLVLNISVIIGLLIAVIVLSIQLKKARKTTNTTTNCDDCQVCANGQDDSGAPLSICCPKGSIPSIDGHNKKANCLSS